MSFYHGSKNPNIIELTTNHSKDGFVYATSNRLVALTYAARSFPNLFSSENGKEVFNEIKPNLFRKMVEGKSGFIYTLEDKKFEPITQSYKCGHIDCFRIKTNVKVVKKEFIEDFYKEFKKYIKNGEFIVKSYESFSEEKREKMCNNIAMLAKTLTADEINDKNNFWYLFLDNLN